ncbi:hypothetical protein [Nodosilinea sp. P-1105]|nr:hypothetical protein [Nodosilinea sp. P-1105]
MRSLQRGQFFSSGEVVSDRRYGREALMAVGEGAIASTQSAELTCFQGK